LFNSYITEPNQLAFDISNIFKNYPNIECLNHTNVIDYVVYFESWVGGEINLNFGYAINNKENYPSDISFGNNNFIANGINAYDDSMANFFYEPNLLKGNYWSGTGGYTITGLGNVDLYPLENPVIF